MEITKALQCLPSVSRWTFKNLTIFPLQERLW